MLEWIFPSSLYCICCGNIIDESRHYSLCNHCFERIKWEMKSAKVLDGMKCISATEYGIYERRIIFRLKYNRKRYIARIVGNILFDRLIGDAAFNDGVVEPFDLIVPVPMNERKRRKRGFNQSFLIGKYLGKRLKVSCVEALVRNRDTLPMRGLGPIERIENVENVFSLKESYRDYIDGKRVLLIDDFHTTGATANECRKVLELSGAKDIVFLAFAAKNI